MTPDPLINFAVRIATYVSTRIADALHGRLTGMRDAKRTELVRIEDVFGDPLALAKLYIEPNCQNVNPANVNEEEPDAIVNTPIFKKLNAFFNGEFKGEPDGRNQLIVLSDAGMGKTSLLMIIKLSHLVGHEQPGLWPTSKHCVLLKIGETTIQDVTSIADKKNTILLLDALDEDPSAWNNLEQRLKQVLDASKYFYRVVISCRTQFFPDQNSRMVGDSEKVAICGYRCPLIYLSLFDQEQVAAYLKKRYPNYETDDVSMRSIRRSMDIVLKIGTLSLRPMLLAHIDDLIKSEQTFWNEYTTFEALIDSWLDREERKPNTHVKRDQLRRACIVLACAMQARGQRALDVLSFKHFLDLYPELKQLDYVEIGGRSLLNRNSKGEYRFCHYTIQEFLIAQRLIYPDKQFSVFELKLTDRVLRFLSDYTLSKQAKPREPNQQGQFVLDGLDLSSQNLVNAKLPGASFVGTNLSNARLEGAILTGADFSDASFTHANVHGADLEMAKFYRTKIEGTEICQAFCENLRFREVDLSKVDFTGRGITGVIFESVVFSNGMIADVDFSRTRFEKCLFEKVKFSRCNFTSSIFKGCAFKSATFDGEKLSRANFNQEDLRGASFRNANLGKADFTEAEMGGVDLSGANLSEARLVLCKMQKTVLTNCQMRHVNLTRADLTEAVVDGVDAFRSGESTAKFDKTILPDGRTRSGAVVERKSS